MEQQRSTGQRKAFGRTYSFLFLLFPISLQFSVLFAQDGPLTEGVKFLTPPEAIKKMTLPDGFRVNAFAAEPEIVQPFAFTFDDRGRVWLCENLNYETRGSDSFDKGPMGRIVILEDTNGDGRADKKTMFADKLFFPTGLAIGFGGVWVGSPPNLLFIPDRNHDDVPDGDPEIVLDGWGRQDRHETLNSFTWGPDGWLYGLQGVFTRSKVGVPGTPDDERVSINAGVWRLHPVTKKFEIFAWGTSNPWGLDFDEHGQLFLTACVIPHLWHIAKGGRYHRQSGQHFNPHIYNDIKTITDHKHASAHGGARFYLADQFPEQYRGRLFMCNIHEHGVLSDVITRKGSGFRGAHGDDFCMANDKQWLGFNMEIGPDGSIFVIDWHDADICGRKVLHQETGRLWRISYGEAAYPKFNLQEKSDLKLVDLLVTAKNEWHSRQARRILQERADSLDKKSEQQLRDHFDNQRELPKKLRALWGLWVTGRAKNEWLMKLLDHEEETIRAWAIQFLAERGEFRKEWITMARQDSSPVVRLYLASAMQSFPPEKRWPVLEGLALHNEDINDHNLPLMLWFALEPGVMKNPDRAIKLAGETKIDLLAQYVARRISSDARPGNSIPISDAKKTPSSTSVSSDGLVLNLKISQLREQKGRVKKWGGTQQNDESARPEFRTNLSGRSALYFDGENDRLEMPLHNDLVFSETDSFTLSAWVFPEGRQKDWAGLVTRSRDAAPWYGFWISPGQRWTAGATNSSLSGPEMQAGWHHLCVVQNGEEGKRDFFVNGYLVKSGEPRPSNGKGVLWIGGAASVNEFFKGGIGDVQIYQRALNPGEVSYLADFPVGLSKDNNEAKLVSPFSKLLSQLGESNEPRLQSSMLIGIHEGLAGLPSLDKPGSWDSTNTALSKSDDKSVRELTQRLSVILGDETSLRTLRDLMNNRSGETAERIRALETLVRKRIPDLAADLQLLLDDPGIRAAAIRGLGIIPDKMTPEKIFQHYDSFSTQEKLDAVNALAFRADSGLALLLAIETSKIPRNDVTASAARQLSSLKDDAISRKLETVWGKVRPTPAEKRELFSHYRKVLSRKALNKANTEHGRQVFRRICGQCHKLFDEGGTIAPDLTGSDRRNVEYILDNVLDPNGAIGKDYQYSTFTLNDARVLLGIVIGENETSVTVKTLGGESVINKADIQLREQLPVSMMPEGLFQTLTDREVRDLVRYLQSETKGKQDIPPK